MQQEETEYRSDGTKKVIRPARLSLARVSVLRGDGPKEGVPFIDDHIHTSEIIVDYLTEFSGIKCTLTLFRVARGHPANTAMSQSGTWTRTYRGIHLLRSKWCTRSCVCWWIAAVSS